MPASLGTENGLVLWEATLKFKQAPPVDNPRFKSKKNQISKNILFLI